MVVLLHPSVRILIKARRRMKETQLMGISILLNKTNKIYNALFKDKTRKILKLEIPSHDGK